MNTYKCCVCKKAHDGEPRVTNGAGEICASCWEGMLKKSRSTLDAKWAEKKGTCKYCGDTNNNPNIIWADYTVCPKCLSWRDRSLILIRHSDVAAKHIAKVEARESEAREDRKTAESLMKVMPPVPAVEVAHAKVDRIDRLEQMMIKLAQEFGVKL